MMNLAGSKPRNNFEQRYSPNANIRNNFMRTGILNTLLMATALSLSAFSPIGSSRALAQESEAPAALDELAPVEPKKIKTVDADPALWVVKDDDTTIYLFGTIHVLKPGFSWFDEGVKAAFDKSDSLVLELVPPPQAEMTALFSKLAIDKSGKTLRSKMDGEDKAKYETAMKALGIPVASFDALDPWAAAVTMQVIAMSKAGFSPTDGAETVLTSAAKQAKKPITGLETAEYQLGLFDALPQDTQIRFLIDGSTDLEAGKEGLDLLVSAWAKGDPEGLAKLMNEGLTDRLLFERLLTQRNANWARWINKRMAKPGTVFIAVGAGHLSGTTSVPQMITAYGLKATRVNY